jgi:hypothetical protein
VASDRYVEHEMMDEIRNTTMSSKPKFSQRNQLTAVGFSILILMLILISFGG